MMMRQLPALCAAVMMLAGCANDRGSDPKTAAPLTSSDKWTVVPGEPEYGNVGNTINFDTDSAVLEADAQRMLDRQAAWLQDFPKHMVTIEGHADERGTREYNLALGERRADAVMRYLIALGVDPKRLKTISYGKERPICTEANEACWSQNRRVVSMLDN
jgi:peptidoglycan-associated lipoprotein